MKPLGPSPHQVRWQTVETTAHSVRRWPDEDEGVVFNGASGDLHLLNPTALAVLAHLAEAPSTLDELAEQFPAPDGALAALIATFDALGLARPIAP